MDRALQNLISIGLDLADVAKRLATYPADFLGITDRGRIAIGAWADFVVLNQANCLEQVFVEGEAIAL
jgi:N-acetylglucosamine-6-phosphate deacetylase